jgi:small GTP-binding protein
MENSERFDYQVKYIIIGDAAVGKSNILLRYTEDKFIGDHQCTLGVEFTTKEISFDDKILKLQIWDTAGSEAFRSIARAFYKNAAVVIIVYDVGDISTFENVSMWLKECKNENTNNIVKLLIPNKNDIPEERKVVNPEKAREFAEQEDMIFLEVSAKTGFNIKEVFEQSAKVVYQNIKNNIYDLSSPMDGIRLNSQAVLPGAIKLDSKDSKGKDKKKNGYCC